jgi:ABC-type lipoprotein release transport system permease subunit
MGRVSDHPNVMLRRQTRELAGTLTVADVTLQGQTASCTTGQRATHGTTGTLNTLIALRRRRELALLRLTGATTRQVRSMARWEATLIISMGLGIGLAIAATALLPLSHALTGGFRPYAPAGWFAAILGVSALLALVALSVPTRRALRTRPVEAIGIRE